VPSPLIATELSQSAWPSRVRINAAPGAVKLGVTERSQGVRLPKISEQTLTPLGAESIRM
jgi:hypothetical protein